MFQFFFRCLVVIVTIIIQVSFLPALFSQETVPLLILAVAIAWTVAAGFEDSWLWVIVLGILYDLASFHPIGMSSVLLILGAYGISFISRRFFLEHEGTGVLLSAAIMFGYSFLVEILYLLMERGMAELLEKIILSASFWWSGFFVAIVSTVLFLPIFVGLRSLERFLSFYDHRTALRQ